MPKLSARSLVLFSACACFFGCLGNTDPDPKAEGRVTVAVRDTSGHSMSATSVEWWYPPVGTDTVKALAVCANADCSQWTLSQGIHGTISIRVVLKNQPWGSGCWADGTAIRSFVADSTQNQNVEIVVEHYMLTCM
jgi:hypothetical protein